MINSTNHTSSVPPILTQQFQRDPLAAKLGEATALRMEQITRISEQARANGIITEGLSASLSNQPHPPIGIQYPSEFPHSHPDFNRLKEEGHFMNWYAPQAFWVVTAPRQFQVKDEVRPSDAIEAMIQGPVVGDCRIAAELAQYAGLMDTITKGIFDRFFRNGTSNHIRLGYDLTEAENPIIRLTAFTPAAKNQTLGKEGNRPIRTGHVAFFEGHPRYSAKHPGKHLGGINVICRQKTDTDQIFLGLGLSPDGVSERELKELLLNGYNQEVEVEAFAHFPLEHRQKMPRLIQLSRQLLNHDQGTLESITGFSPNSTVAWRLKEIQEIMDRFQIETVRGSVTATSPSPV